VVMFLHDGYRWKKLQHGTIRLRRFMVAREFHGGAPLATRSCHAQILCAGQFRWSLWSAIFDFGVGDIVNIGAGWVGWSYGWSIGCHISLLAMVRMGRYISRSGQVRHIPWVQWLGLSIDGFVYLRHV